MFYACAKKVMKTESTKQLPSNYVFDKPTNGKTGLAKCLKNINLSS